MLPKERRSYDNIKRWLAFSILINIFFLILTINSMRQVNSDFFNDKKTYEIYLNELDKKDSISKNTKKDTIIEMIKEEIKKPKIKKPKIELDTINYSSDTINKIIIINDTI